MSEKQHWQQLIQTRYSRRTMLGVSAKAGVGAAGLALVGCGDDDDDDEAVADAPVDEAPEDEAPVDEAPADEEPADEEPADEEPADEEPADAPVDEAPADGVDDVQVLNVSMRGETNSLDPQRATDTNSIAILKQIYAPLIHVDTNLDLQPILAAEIPTVENGGISEDGMTYTFKLREGLQWSDGQALVAQDLVNGAKRLFDPGSGNFYVDFYRVLAADGQNLATAIALGAGEDTTELELSVIENLEVTAPDDRTVVYQLNTRSPVFLLLASLWPLYPIRQDIVDEFGDTWTDPANHISNGAMTLASWNREQDQTMVRNPNYHLEPAKLETLFVDQISDTAIGFLAYQEGEIDVFWAGPEEVAQIREDEALQQEFISYAQQITLGIYFNFSVPALQDRRIRRAMAMAVNREEYAAIVLEGAAIPAYSWLPPGVPGHEPDAGRSLYFDQAIEDAQDLLAEAGFPGGEGLTFEILLSDSSSAKLTGEWLKEQWETKLGITITLNILEAATYFGERNQGNYQLTAGGWGSDYGDPQNWMPLFQTGGLLNSGDFSNADYDALLEAANVELDNTTRIDLYRQADALFQEELPFMTLNYRVRAVLVKPYVKGLVPTSSESGVPGDDHFHLAYISGKNA
jgi:oligopeptide transport system substrate-binding protein